MPVKRRKDVEPTLEEAKPTKPGKPVYQRKKPKRKVTMPPDLAERQARGRPVTITLRYQHKINEVPYGPGRVTVKKDVASVLLEQERNLTQVMHDELNPKAVVINGDTRQIYRVPAQLFEQAYQRLFT